jgi:prepilin-type N-terminal cleavage/methylation domain-containing protein
MTKKNAQIILRLLRRPLNKVEAGFTLIETLVALVIVGLAVAAATSSLMTNLTFNRKAERAFEGAQAAQTVLDEIRKEDVSTLPASGADSVRQISTQSRRTYDVYVSYCTDGTYCTDNDVRQLSVRVEHKGAVVYQTQTVFTAFGTTSSASSSSAGSTSSSVSSSASSSVSSSSSSSVSVSSSSSASTSSASSSASTSSSSSSRSSSSRSSRCRSYRC